MSAKARGSWEDAHSSSPGFQPCIFTWLRQLYTALHAGFRTTQAEMCMPNAEVLSHTSLGNCCVMGHKIYASGPVFCPFLPLLFFYIFLFYELRM